MEMKVQVPFQQLLSIVKKLRPGQKAKLRAELKEEHAAPKKDDDFIEYLLGGPVYNEKDLQTIEKNRKSIASWRKKS